ncbi:HU family DNA-binding protein [Hydrogenophaga sp. 2FB]|uniref:HU family DNA-binding protein n=1 Tax=Hydrogenophaga sp. 2FB TaxID=2502187 RepID=UPI0010F604CA|nr:HU family DNA-binding protein [Hydrogenophaga sp. 2FB]
MATTKKTAAAKPSPVKKAAPVKKSAPVKKATSVKVAPVKAAPVKSAAAKPALNVLPAALKPIKTALSKTALQVHLAELTGVDAKAVKAVLAGLELTVLASVNKKGLGEFTLPGLLKVTSLAIPAKKKRRGIDPFTKVEREFAAKPATVRIKVRSLKKLKDAAL